MAQKSFFRWLKKRFKKEYTRLHTLYELEAANPTCRFEENIQITSPDRLHLGKHVYISRNCILDCGGEEWCDYRGSITLGDHVHIGPNCVVDGAGEIELGPRCRLGIGVMLLTQMLTPEVMGKPELLDQFAPPHKFGKITLEEGALIGAGSVVTLGVTIGRGSIISGSCLIKKSVPPYTIVVPRHTFKNISTKSPLIPQK